MLHVIVATQDGKLAEVAKQRVEEEALKREIPIKTYITDLTDEQRAAEGSDLAYCTFEAPEDADLDKMESGLGIMLVLAGKIVPILREDWIQELSDELAPRDEQ